MYFIISRFSEGVKNKLFNITACDKERHHTQMNIGCCCDRRS